MSETATTVTKPINLSSIILLKDAQYRSLNDENVHRLVGLLEEDVEFSDPIADGERRERRLVMMTGSHHMHVFWYESGIEKTPAQLPILYLIDQQRWIPRRSAFLRPAEMEMENATELGRWNQTCCQCHSTHPRQRPDRTRRTWEACAGRPRSRRSSI